MDDLGVYLHLPFCERICPYCDFAVIAARQIAAADEQRYVEALLCELERREPDFRGLRLETLYFGGGTPSLFQAASLATLVEALRRAFPGAPSEVTLEVNPSTLESERLPDFRAAGIDRISLGIQSFHDTTLRKLGRAHRAEEGPRALQACREAGFRRLSLDLIASAPAQSEADFDLELETAIGFAPEHLSVYGLTLEPGTPFAEAARRGKLDLPEEEVAARMLERAESKLEAAGYRHYEISSYAKPGSEAVHNRRYWERRPVLGLGLSAVSSDPSGPGRPHGARRHNPRSLPDYLACAAGKALAPVEVLDPQTARGEAVFLALRTAEGLEPLRFAREFGGSPRDFFADAIDPLLNEALLQEGPRGELRLTPRGRMLSDSVFQRFV